MATALCRGGVTLQSYSEAALADPEILDLAQRLTFDVTADPAATDNATRGTLSLTTRDGRMFSQHVENPLGHPTRPMSESDLLEKFVQCAGASRNRAIASRANDIVRAILKLDSIVDLHEKLFVLLE